MFRVAPAMCLCGKESLGHLAKGFSPILRHALGLAKGYWILAVSECRPELNRELPCLHKADGIGRPEACLALLASPFEHEHPALGASFVDLEIEATAIRMAPRT